MRLKTLSLTATIAASCLQFAAIAQNDSSRLDAGAITFKRAFTQHIRIKGEDLEKMPFANLGEAIDAWFYGAYTQMSNTVYVVDGNVLSDVNAYSVYDIEEVVLVQDAAAMIQMASGQQQQLVLITTRKGAAKKPGIRAAAKTGLAHQPSSHSNLYQQYYLGLQGGLGKGGPGNGIFGLSADYLRDVFPTVQSNDLKTITPYHLDRLRLNGYLSFQVGAHNKVELHVNYTPQWLDSANTHPLYTSIYRNEGHGRQHVFMPWARWHSDLLPGLKNDLQAGYISTLYNVDVSAVNQHPGNGDPTSSLVRGNTHADHVFLRDRIGGVITAGGWTFEPTLNISYEHYSKRSSYTILDISGGFPNTSTSATGLKGTAIFLTPTVDLTYRSLLHIQAGVLEDLSEYQGYKPPQRNYPFANLSIDLLALSGQQHASRLQLFGSYAKTALGTGNDFPLTDLSGNNNVFVSISQTGFLGMFIYSPTPIYLSETPPSNFWVWQTGLQLSLPGDRFSVSYNFERQNFLTQAFIPVPQGGNGMGYVYDYPEWKSSQHRLGIQWKVFDGKDLRWQTGLNTTVLKSKTYIGPGEIFLPPVGDFNTDKPSWTGGFVNRLEWRHFLAGVDLVYHFNGQVVLDPTTGSTERINSLQLQNVYAGYRLQLSKDRPLELYLNSRSPYQSSRSNLGDQRRYYGVGGKMTI